MAVQLTPEKIRLYIKDRVDVNYLLENETQFTDERINNAMELALDQINLVPPITGYTDMSLLPAATRYLMVLGTLAHLYYGEAGLAARNQFSYSDGGLTVPLEERFQYWMTLAQQMSNEFQTAVKQWKVAANLDGSLNGNSSWGEVRSDFSNFPTW